MLSGKRQLSRLPAIRCFSRRPAPASICFGITRTGGGSSRSRCMSWRDAQTLTLYRSDADPPSRRGERIEDFRWFVAPLLVVGLVLVLIVVEPDLGTAAVIGLVTLSLLFIGGARLGHLSMIGLAALSVLYLLIWGVSYRRQRMLSFLDPWSDPEGSGFQVIQSFLA